MNNDFSPMSVKEMGFLLERLHADCSHNQFVRELTQNSIEAILAKGDSTGSIVWDVDWNRFDLDPNEGMKLCIVDSGIGMTGEDMVGYINQLSSSIHKQSKQGNFGVGAKISAAPLNPYGLVYLSWKDGRGYMVNMYKEIGQQQYGLKRFPNGQYWTYIQNDLKPAEIDDSGTMVILLGKSSEDSTIDAPSGSPAPQSWLVRYLNSRYFTFPEGITLHVRQGARIDRTNTRHNYLANIKGMKKSLDERCMSAGLVHLDDFNAHVHWWILDEAADLDSGFHIPNGHVAILFQNELYDTFQGNAAYAKLQSFGVIFGCSRVVLYIEPHENGNQEVISNTARSNLQINGLQPDFDGYARAFRERMPDELEAFQLEIGQNTDHHDYTEKIDERLSSLKDLYRFRKFKKSGTGSNRAKAHPGMSSKSESESIQRASNPSSQFPPNPRRPRRKPDPYDYFAENDEDPVKEIDRLDIPRIDWVYESDRSREAEDLEDRAARYLFDQHRLIANGDFRIFEDMRERWQNQYSQLEGVSMVVKTVVEEWFSQSLIETVMSALALKRGGGKWSDEEIRQALSEEALTASILPRYHLDIAIKRALGQKLGSLSNLGS